LVQVELLKKRSRYAVSGFFAFVGFVLAGWFGASSCEAEEIKIKHAGLALNAEFQLAEDKTLEDGVVLLVHGTLAHNGMDTIRNLAEVLKERGFNTLAINLSLGIDDRHGMYDSKTPSRHKHLDALDEIAAWLDWLKSKGVGDVVLFGHSRGGNQVARFLSEKGDNKISRGVLLAPATWNAERAANGFKRSHGKPMADVLAKAEGLLRADKGGEMLTKTGILFCKRADVTAASFVSYYRPDPRFNTPTILEESKVPVLVIAGGKDNVVKGLPEAVEPMANGKLISFGLVDDADHFFLDLFAEDVADVMEEFLSLGS